MIAIAVQMRYIKTELCDDTSQYFTAFIRIKRDEYIGHLPQKFRRGGLYIHGKIAIKRYRRTVKLNNV
jgi:hypothetical protein